MKNLSKLIFVLTLLSSTNLYAQSFKQFPNLSGDVLTQLQGDRVLSSKNTNVSDNNAYGYVEANLSLNINKNWSAKTQWRLQPNSILTTRDRVNPERYRTFLNNNRGTDFGEMGLLVEELKIQFENDDMKFFAGKFDPTFGTAWRKSKRIGSFLAQIAEDYNLREKIGAGITAKLESSNITFNSFMNDKTALGESAFNNRGRSSKNISGSENLSSYSIAMEGEDLFSYDNWYYNIGYRSLGMKGGAQNAREDGFVLGSEYLYKLGRESALIPFVELVKIDNLSGQKSRNAQYQTLALIGQYSAWSGSLSLIHRKVKNLTLGTQNDRLLQVTVGYKFTDNLTIDVSRAQLKESGNKASLLGATLTYLYRF